MESAQGFGDATRAGVATVEQLPGPAAGILWDCLVRRPRCVCARTTAPFRSVDRSSEGPLLLGREEGLTSEKRRRTWGDRTRVVLSIEGHI